MNRHIVIVFVGLTCANMAQAADSPCKDQSKGRSNFIAACNSYVKLEEMSSGVVGRYKEDPCSCLIRQFRGIYKLSSSADCSMNREDVEFMFRDEDAKEECIRKK